ncbi:DUF4271 domain-containing protein [Pedobacter metabolipauper]|nr:DUF4271 domain-containing protein [Pedobacter metabolipauper]
MNLSRIISVAILLITINFSTIKAQGTRVSADTLSRTDYYKLKASRDAAFTARQKQVTDSIMTHTWLLPDSLLNSHMIMDSILKSVYGRSNLVLRYKDFSAVKIGKFRSGRPTPKGELWIPSVVAGLLVLFAILKVSFGKQLQTIVYSFFSNRVLNNLNKEDNLFTSWPFLLLFIQFGFTVGMFFYLVSQFYHITFAGSGFKFYLSISGLIVTLYIFKIIILRLLGYLFNVQKPVNEYVTILYLSYFNLSLVFIPLVIAFALSPLKYGPYYIAISFILLGIIFVFQFIRAGVNILSNYRFSKVYLFLYFCALEICPILILIKAIGM